MRNTLIRGSLISIFLKTRTGLKILCYILFQYKVVQLFSRSNYTISQRMNDEAENSHEKNAQYKSSEKCNMPSELRRSTVVWLPGIDVILADRLEHYSEILGNETLRKLCIPIYKPKNLVPSQFLTIDTFSMVLLDNMPLRGFLFI